MRPRWDCCDVITADAITRNASIDVGCKKHVHLHRNIRRHRTIIAVGLPMIVKPT
jgi:hypothetical protein